MSIENSENKINFEALRQELNDLKAQEESASPEEKTTAHFEVINIDELEEEDLVAYQKLKDQKFNPEDLADLRDKAAKSGNGSRQEFAAFLANKLQLQLATQEDRRRI